MWIFARSAERFCDLPGLEKNFTSAKFLPKMTDPRPSEPGKSPGRTDELSTAAFAGLGIQFVLGIFLFLYIGKWIDAKLGTSPAFLIGGVFLAAGGTFYKIYRHLAAEQKLDEEARRQKSEK
jgi:F0F1-type ATP synthase assembly protein I